MPSADACRFACRPPRSAAIGNAGVYYGWKLGRPVPWCTSFPFNAGLRHPQYVGVVLTILGGVALLLSEAMVRAGLVQAALAWAGMYICMSAMEQWNDAKDSQASEGAASKEG